MAKAKVNIPWPHEHMENNYVAYNWPAGSGSYAGAFWERRREKLVDVLSKMNTSYTENIPKLLELSERMISIGKAEQIKEQNFI